MSRESTQFLQHVLECGFATEAELQDSRYAVNQPPQVLADQMVEQGRLTRFQASRLLAGQCDNLLIANLVLLDELGGGELSRVYRAEHRMMKRPVALKVLTSPETDKAAFTSRFLREVQAVASLDHPNIVTAHDAGEWEGTPYLVMEFVDGDDLDKRVTQAGQLPLRETLDYILQAAQGFAYAHAQGIVHRDIKPSNLLVDSNGVVKILDLGLARTNEAADSLTGEFQIVGTIDYMSPEQAETSQVGPASDIYSLGCTLFRLLTGEPPFVAKKPIDILLAHRNAPIPSLRTLRPDVPAKLDALFQKMLSKAASGRPRSMEEVAQVLRTLLKKVSIHKSEKDDHDTSELTLDVIKAEQAKSAKKSKGNSQSDAETRAGTNRRTTQIRQTTPIGIDLGTTGSVIAHVDALGRPRTILNGEGDPITPSAIFFDENVIEVGKEALKAVATEGAHVVQNVKCDIGQRAYHREIRGRLYPPEVLQAMILRKVVSDAERVVGRIRQAVVTVPAYFDEFRRKATQDAAYIAGIEALDIINEPIAAAIAFGAQNGLLSGRTTGVKPKTVLVYDLGGGTFDATVMQIGDRVCRTLATDGDMRLGGRDFDKRLVDHAAKVFLENFGSDPRKEAGEVGLLWRACEEAKHSLSVRARATIAVHYQGESMRVNVTRNQFETMIADLVERTAFTVSSVLADANLSWKDIDYLIPVGGSTRIPAVNAMLTKISGMRPDTSLSPDEAVAAGAALYAGALLQRRHGQAPLFSVQNVNPHTLGVAGRDTATGKQRVSVLIPRNSSLPKQSAKRYKTRTDDQRSLLVKIVEGESGDPNECYQLGSCVLKNLQPGLPKGTPVDVRFQYESNGRLQVGVHVQGESTEQEISREGSLKAKQVEAWRRAICGEESAAPAPAQ